MWKAVVFDLDGVLIDSHHLIRKALQYSYQKVIGRENPPYELFFRHMGDSLSNILRRIELPQEMALPFLDKSEELQQQIVVEPNVLSMLVQLQKKGLRIGICTGKDSKRTQEILEQTGILPFVSCVLCSDMVQHPKPAPDSLLKAVIELKVKAHEALMVGDAPHDIACARGAGVQSVAATWYTNSTKQLLDADPSYVCETPESFLRLLDSNDDQGGSSRVVEH